MKFPLFIANRYVRSKKQAGFVSLISVITITGIALGVAVVIMSLTILEGFEKEVTEKILNFNSHIYITGFGARNLPDYTQTVPMIEEAAGENISTISPFISKYAIIKSKSLSEGIQLIGIEPENSAYRIKEYITEGDYNFTAEERPGIIVGRKLADMLFIKPGDKVTIFALSREAPPSPGNPPVIKQLTVTGVYESGMAAYDDINAYININQARKIYDINNMVSGYNIKLTDAALADSMAEKLQDKLGYPFYVRTIFAQFQSIFTWIELQKAPIPIILGLIIIVATFNIIGTLLMVVLERTNAVGTLMSMGASKRQISGIFIYQGLYLSMIGIVSGNLLAFVISWLQREYEIISLPSSVYFLSSVPVSIDPVNYIMVSGITFIVSLLAAYLPGRFASNLNPSFALKFN